MCYIVYVLLAEFEAYHPFLLLFLWFTCTAESGVLYVALNYFSSKLLSLLSSATLCNCLQHYNTINNYNNFILNMLRGCCTQCNVGKLRNTVVLQPQ